MERGTAPQVASGRSKESAMASATTFLISHTLALEEAPKGYRLFHDSQNEVTKVVLRPDLAVAAE
jgi:threonine dehydrogenase-like Zn-dependent dehydrogenase